MKLSHEDIGTGAEKVLKGEDCSTDKELNAKKKTVFGLITM